MTNWLPGGAIREVIASHTHAGQLVPVAAAVLIAYAAVLITATVLLDRSREI